MVPERLTSGRYSTENVGLSLDLRKWDGRLRKVGWLGAVRPEVAAGRAGQPVGGRRRGVSAAPWHG